MLIPAPRRDVPRMFIYYFANLERKFTDLADDFSRQPFESWADTAYRDGEQLRARLSAGERGLLAKTVTLEVGTEVRGEKHITVPIAWSATGTPGLFPRLDADLVLAPVGPTASQVSLRGNYEPPLGPVGRSMDRAVFHRIAEACVKEFVDGVAASLDAAVSKN